HIGERLIATEQRRRQERCAGRQIERVSVPLEDTHVGIKALEERMRCTNAVLRDWGRIGLMLGERWPMGRQDCRSSTMVARVDATRPVESPRGRKRSEEVLVTKNYAGLPEPPVWLSCVAAVRTGPAVFAARPSGMFGFVDPGSKLVLVQTAAREVRFQDEELFALWAALRSQ